MPWNHIYLLKGITVKQAKSDADALIVSTALQTAETTQNSVIVVGNDTDLMAILISQADPSYDNFLMVETNPPLFYKISDIQSKYDRQHCELCLFLHYFTSSDTTSAFYNKGKKIGYNCFLKLNGDNLDELSVFFRSNVDDIARAVEHFALQMYGAKVSCSVHKLRNLTYFKAIGNSNLSTSFKLECLPPTSAALRQHSYRTYHAVQQALGRSLPALDWGWMNQNDILMPVLTDKPAAPERLLKLVSCRCKSGWQKMCSCRKLGIYCTVMCRGCNGQTCVNISKVDISNDADDDDWVIIILCLIFLYL